MAHAQLGPSGSDRWMSCAGSIALSTDLPNRSNDAADQGTCYHFLASECLTLELDVASFIGTTVIVDADDECYFKEDFPPGLKARYTEVVDQDNADYLQRYLDYVRTAGHGQRTFVEVAVPIDHLTGEQDAEGTADCVIINAEQRELHVTDLKFGRGVEVFAEENPQMMMYALGAIAKYPDETASLTNIRLTICQPRSGDGKPKEWTCTRQHLEEFGAKVKRASNSVWAALDLYNQIKDAGNDDAMQSWCDANLLVTTKGCQFCRAKARCPKIAGEVARTTAADFDNLDQVELPVDIVELPAQHVNQDLANKMLKCDLIEGWIKAVRAEVESELTAGREVPHFKLVQGRKGNRDWTSEDAAIKLLKGFRLKVDEMYDFSLKSPPKIEKLLGKQVKRWPKVLPLIHQPDGKISVAHESDKRDAVSIAATTDGMENLDFVEDLV